MPRPEINIDSPMVITAINMYKEKTNHIIDTEIKWDENKQLMKVDVMNSWLMPDDEGGTYWESDVASHSEYTWNEFQYELMTLN